MMITKYSNLIIITKYRSQMFLKADKREKTLNWRQTHIVFFLSATQARRNLLTCQSEAL